MPDSTSQNTPEISHEIEIPDELWDAALREGHADPAEFFQQLICEFVTPLHPGATFREIDRRAYLLAGGFLREGAALRWAQSRVIDQIGREVDIFSGEQGRNALCAAVREAVKRFYRDHGGSEMMSDPHLTEASSMLGVIKDELRIAARAYANGSLSLEELGAAARAFAEAERALDLRKQGDDDDGDPS
jgi:hypothetical protein